MCMYHNGRLLPASAPRRRKIELLGDSISAGYGSRGDAKLNAANSCPVNAITSGNKYTYNWKIAEHFNADLVPIAWSGKGMYANCCDNGERMPAYWLQTLGGSSYSTDWDHSRYVPDMVIINLGTNDFGHDAGPTWEKAFSDTYTEFVLNATRIYKNPKLPVFVAQGPMNCDAKLGAALNVSIVAINAAGGRAVFLDLKGPPNDGCGGHPGALGHEAMAEMAYPQIAKVMNWE
jgi:lysophospholipase L1-like esterase